LIRVSLELPQLILNSLFGETKKREEERLQREVHTSNKREETQGAQICKPGSMLIIVVSH
jgi:hypothetical protein